MVTGYWSLTAVKNKDLGFARYWQALLVYDLLSIIQHRVSRIKHLKSNNIIPNSAYFSIKI